MQKKLLLDGCSYTYGLNLLKEHTLEHHFIESGYEVLNLSRPGKSNNAIALDVYNNINAYNLYYPHVPPLHRLPCGHLNADGTTNLYNNLTHIIEQ